MFYRFKDGSFIEADDFSEAKKKKLEQIKNETENENRWHKCRCLGMRHRIGCPEHVMCD